MDGGTILDQRVGGRGAWTRADLQRSEFHREFPPECLAEIRAVLKLIRGHVMPPHMWTHQEFPFDACRAFMRGIRDILDNGVRFALIDRLPVEEMSVDEAKAIYWALSSMIARPVAQKHNAFDPNAFLSDVLDTGLKPLPGSGVRPDRTNVDLLYHNDNAFNHTMPEYVGLLCLNPAKSGGVSRVMSFYTVHNALLAEHREALARLYQPFWIDRQKEHDAADTPFIEKPMFEYDGQQLRARLCLHQVKNGYAMRGESVDDRTQASILALEDVFEHESLTLHFTMERGQLQYCNNLETGHSRTEFVDFDDPAQKRHLVRIWLRDKGLRAYRG
jgi:hypothetical protein